MERNLNRVIATAPFLYAPSREPLDLGKLNDGGAVELNWERQSYGLRIFGALPEELPPRLQGFPAAGAERDRPDL